MNGVRISDNDYYVILDIIPTATPAEITGAYYVLARKYHPDATANDPACALKFKKINEAYEVLSDEEKRRIYDGQIQSRRRSPATFGFGPIPNERTTIQRPKRPVVTTAAGPLDIDVELPVRPEEARYGGPCHFTLNVGRHCEHCESSGWIGNRSCNKCLGKGQIRQQQRLQIHLPSGLRTGSIIRIPGQGHRRRTAAGNLLVRVKILPCW